MDSREILLILHLVGAFLLVGGAGAETALGIRAASSTSTRVIAAAMQMARAIENFVIMPGRAGGDRLRHLARDRPRS